MQNPSRSVSRRCFGPSTLIAVAALSLAACTTIRPPAPLIEDEQISQVSTEKGMDRYVGFRSAYIEAKTRTQNPVASAALLTEGMALVQANCSNYFTRLGRETQHLGFARKETSLGGGLTAGAMGLADVGAKTISATASIFGFTTATMDNFADSYLFSPDVRSVQDLVMSALEAQQKIGIQITQDALNGKTLTYTQVSQFLIEMESYCQPHGIRAMVTKAVNTQKAVPVFESDSAEQLDQSVKELDAAAQKIRNAASESASSGPITPPSSAGGAGSAMRSQALMLQSR